MAPRFMMLLIVLILSAAGCQPPSPVSPPAGPTPRPYPLEAGVTEPQPPPDWFRLDISMERERYRRGEPVLLKYEPRSVDPLLPRRIVLSPVGAHDKVRVIGPGGAELVCREKLRDPFYALRGQVFWELTTSRKHPHSARLDELFDLTRPGEYRACILWHLHTADLPRVDQDVQSEWVRFIVE